MDQKAVVALLLIEEWAKDCANVPPEALEAARKIFGNLNQHFVKAGN